MTAIAKYEFLEEKLGFMLLCVIVGGGGGGGVGSNFQFLEKKPSKLFSYYKRMT